MNRPPGGCPMCPLFQALYEMARWCVKRLACWVEDRVTGEHGAESMLAWDFDLPADWTLGGS